ncbi:hypothetical protein ACSMXN_18370 [Jatrophihabitans sp. DSM 45814]
MVQLLAAWFGARYVAVQQRVRPQANERGDVPGWVMVTVMTAALVVAILGVFKPQIINAINQAMSRVGAAN